MPPRQRKSSGKSKKQSDKASPASPAPAEDTKEGAQPLGAVVLYFLALSPAVAAALVLRSLPFLLGEELGGAIVSKALAKAFRGGIPGAVSALLQIVLLMWLRTTINYQYKYGVSMNQALKTLYADGGVARFYRGWHVAAAQVPISRFVDAAANAGMLELFHGIEWLPVVFKTAAASGAAGLFRATLMPMDCIKTELQVNGNRAMPLLRARLAKEGFFTFWRGAAAAMIATAVGHYPWFAVKNMLESILKGHDLLFENSPVMGIVVAACVGFISSVASDTTTNSIRVVKTRVQTSEENLGYLGTIQKIVKEDGWFSLFFRGLGTKTVTSALNGLIFNVMLKQFR